MKMIALKPIHRLRPGDEFEATRTQARVLVAIGKAREAPAPAPEPPRRAAPPRTQAEPEPEKTAEPEHHEPRASRFYRRRDMQPEE